MKLDKIEVFPVLLSRFGDDNFIGDGSALPMGCLTSYLKHRDNGALLEHYEIHPLVNRKKKDWAYYSEQAKLRASKPSIWLFSCYVWNRDDNLAIAKSVKDLSPNSLIIVGGPHIPGYLKECEAFLTAHPYIDIAVRGEGEKTLAELLETIVKNGHIANVDFSGVAGITFKYKNRFVRTADRIRSNNLDEFPSPYLTGEFDDESFNEIHGMVLETNRGCPYGCTYCDWGSAILQKVRHFDLDRVIREIDYIGSKKAVHLHLGDANFGAFQRDIEIAKAVVAANKKHGFPKRIAYSNAKNGSAIIAEVVKILTNGGLVTQGIVAIQTIDESVLEAINRSNIKNKNMEVLLDIFREENLTLTSELLIGLPGQTVKSHKADLQYIIERKITTTGYQVQIMPNAPMNDPAYIEKYKIKLDKDDFVIETSTFTGKEYLEMCELFLAFQFFYMASVMKYFLYYLQLEHSVKAMDFIEALLEEPTKYPDRYPFGYRIRRDLITKTDPKSVGVLKLQWKTQESEFLFNNLGAYYDEVFALAENVFGVGMTDSEKQTLKAVQMGVMPMLGKSVPLLIKLEHDFVGYFQQIKLARVVSEKTENFMPLKSFLPGMLKVQALQPKVIDNLTFIMTTTTTGKGWELRSPLQFVKSRIKKHAKQTG